MKFAPKRIHPSALKAKGVWKPVCRTETRRHVFVWTDEVVYLQKRHRYH